MRPTRSTALLRLAAVTTLIALGAPLTATSSAARDDGRRQACVSSRLPRTGPAVDVMRIAKEAQAELDLKSVLLRVTVDGHELVTGALGESMTGVPAEPAMHFRNGNVAIAYMGTALLRLVDEGKVALDDPIGRWLPGLPHGEGKKITLRMLASSTSGLIDYVTDPDFGDAVSADPFRQWTAEELVRIATSKPLLYEPGTNFSYSHANFVLLGAALEKITGTPLDVLLQQKIMGPLGLTETRNSFTPDIPTPVLHAFTAERGTYEESTFWNPSWSTAPGAVQTTDICDLARSASGIGSGRLLSPAGYREMLNPGTVGLGHPTATCPATVCLANTEATHYGMGLLVLNNWVVQHPLFFGYGAAQAYLPSDHLAIAVSTTKGRNTPEGHSAQFFTQRIAAALAPHHPIPDFG